MRLVIALALLASTLAAPAFAGPNEDLAALRAAASPFILKGQGAKAYAKGTRQTWNMWAYLSNAAMISQGVKPGQLLVVQGPIVDRRAGYYIMNISTNGFQCRFKADKHPFKRGQMVMLGVAYRGIGYHPDPLFNVDLKAVLLDDLNAWD